MNKIKCAISLIIMCLFAVSFAACEQTTWDCPECGRTGNNSNYCGDCAHPAPWMDTMNTADSDTLPIRSNQSVSVGSVVSFGRYEQDNNLSNGAELIEWIVLDIQDGKCLLTSRYGLFCSQFYTGDEQDKATEVTWANSSLRDKLNAEFFNSAFSPDEQDAICTTEIADDQKIDYDGLVDCNTDTVYDKVFVLDVKQAGQYFKASLAEVPNIQSQVAPTEYAKANNTWFSDTRKTIDGKAAGWWWLRTCGLHISDKNRDAWCAAGIGSDGVIYLHSGVNDRRACIRPSLWINLDAIGN